MTVARKMVLLLLVIFVLLSASLFGFHRYIILEGFSGLEFKEAAQDLERAILAIEGQAERLGLTCWDWAAWDHTYEFIQDKNSLYIESNLVPSSFFDNRINLFNLYDEHGNLVWGQIWDLEEEVQLTLPELSEGRLHSTHPLLFRAKPGQAYKDAAKTGLYPSSSGPMIVAVYPILDSNNVGPPKGTFLMGIFLDDRFLERMAIQTRLTLSLDQPRPPGPEDAVILHNNRPIYFAKSSSETLVVSTVLPSLMGKPVLTLSAHIPRNIFQQGLRMTSLSLAATVIICAIYFLLLHQMVRRTVLLPVRSLTQRLNLLGRDQTASLPLTLGSADEIGALSNAFDALVEKIRQSALHLEDANQALKADIVEREKIEQALKKSEDYFRNILSSIQEEIFIVDANGIITDLNAPFLDKCGLSQEGAVGKHCAEALECWEKEPSQGISPMAAFRIVLKTRQAHTGRCEMENSLGNALWLDILFSPVTDDVGRIKSIIAAVRDVTREVELARRGFAMQKIEAVGTLAGGVAHDFNNILMSIMLNIEYGIKKSADSPQLRQALEKALESSQRAKDLVGQLLAFSRSGVHTPENFSLSPVVKETIKLVRASCPENISVTVSINAENDTVRATPYQIQQILLNLCTNAIQAMPKGGDLRVFLENAKLAEADEDYSHLPDNSEFVVLSVKDTGCGMSHHVLERIYEPFFTTRKIGEGTGLGLSVVHGIVLELGGFLRVQSRIGSGTIFDVWIPASQTSAQQEALDRNALQESLGRPLQVLVVDDQPILANAIAAGLDDLGYRSFVELSAGSALEKIKKAPSFFDAVVLDMRMPDMNGLELAKIINDIRPDLPVILCSGFSENALEQIERLPNIKSVVRKPVTAAEIAKEILKVAPKAKRRAATPEYDTGQSKELQKPAI
ncbi:MAG: CHASE4 domain-containing protein [Desulfatibacillaceae bacterium]|nr:CHASE4 domain-containing protein [Desulfatibacillaceae bacterium]